VVIDARLARYGRVRVGAHLLRCLRLGIVMHILTNSFGILVALLGVLT